MALTPPGTIGLLNFRLIRHSHQPRKILCNIQLGPRSKDKKAEGLGLQYTADWRPELELSKENVQGSYENHPWTCVFDQEGSEKKKNPGTWDSSLEDMEEVRGFPLSYASKSKTKWFGDGNALKV